MVSSIGSSSAMSYISVARPKAGLEAQIAKYKKELSSCVNCDSAKTAEGKANIQVISDKINQLTSQVQEISKSQTVQQSSQFNEGSDMQKKMDGLTAASLQNRDQSEANGLVMGSRLDIFV
jgi:fructose-1,6-bisphosphatase